ncbi:SsrA-binding protein [bacterium (Candidatus Howlettbacteria) CG_4_10_14_0_8_um_filter_40_9]|nr:MAG: SsrA-binding protein [bacterium (Candidatus Howlettbacteria) CG_4_10_14_0_8_um_filter_40_9]
MKTGKIIATNKKAHFDYEIHDTFEAGVVLTGPEVKSVKSGNISLKESYAVVKGNEIFLLNAHISPYKFAANEGEDPARSRKLLLKSSEIKSLIGKTSEKGLTLIPTKVYLKYGLVKIELGLGKGKKKFEKRAKIKERDIGRDIEREIRGKS